MSYTVSDYSFIMKYAVKCDILSVRKAKNVGIPSR